MKTTTLKTKLYLILLALLIPTSSAKATCCSIAPEEAKIELDYLREYYDDLQINTNPQQLIDFACLWGDIIENTMYLKLYAVPLHRVVVILHDKLAILEKTVPYLDEADQKDADTFVQNFHYYINVIVNSHEYSEEKKLMIQQQQTMLNNFFIATLILSLYRLHITYQTREISNLQQKRPYHIDLLWAGRFGFFAGVTSSVASVIITRAADAVINWVHNVGMKKTAEQTLVVAKLRAEEAAE